jgi:DinB superfamily/ClpX C4-type zinc finger
MAHRQRTESSNALQCSFCHKTEDAVGKLISNPSDYPRAYICNECIAVCWRTLEDDKTSAFAARPAPSGSTEAVPPPDPSEYAPYYGRYISLVPGTDLFAALRAQRPETLELFSGLNGDRQYAAGKWTVKEVLGHLIDTERIMAYRALRIARNDATPLPGFEQDDYVRYGGFGACRLTDLMDEFDCVRETTLFLFEKLPAEAWLRRGTASENAVSARALGYIIAGHELHHRRILKEKYAR